MQIEKLMRNADLNVEAFLSIMMVRCSARLELCSAPPRGYGRASADKVAG
jgi:hypothetical protein